MPLNHTTIQEFLSLENVGKRRQFLWKMWVKLLLIYIYIFFLRDRNTVIFSLAHVFDVVSAEMSTQIKIMSSKDISSHKKTSTKMYFCHDHHLVVKNKLDVHVCLVDKNGFFQQKDFYRQKQNFFLHQGERRKTF